MASDDRDGDAGAQVRLVFAQPEVVRPRDISSVLMDLETLYLMASGEELSSLVLEPSNAAWYPAEPYWRPDQLVVRRVEFGSPLQTVLEVPWSTWSEVGTFFAGALAAVYGLPKAAGALQAAREEFWTKRLAADRAKEAFIEWRKNAAEQRGVHLLKADLPPILDAGDSRAPELD